MRNTLKLATVALSFALLPALALAQVTATPAATVISFNPAAVGVAAGSAQQLTATFAVSGYTGSFTPTATLHYGFDYSTGAVNCTVTAGGENCSVPITFQPTLPGARRDAIFLWNGTTRLASVLLGGVGQAPLALIQPGVLTTSTPTSGAYVYNVTVDENDTAYYVTNGSSIYSITKGGVVTQIPITGLNGGTLVGLAIDGAGVLYISPYNYGKALLTYDTVTGTQGTLPMAPPAPYSPCSNSNGGTLEYLTGAATDAIGNVFTLESLCNEIFERKADGTFATTVLNPAITQPYRIAVDSGDDVFIGGYAINELTSGGTQSQINTLGASDGLAVDAADSLYATRYTTGPGSQGVALLPASDYTTYIAAFDPAASPLGLGLASDGTLFVGNYGNLDKVDRTQGAIDFGSQSIGVASAVKNVGIYNGGNENLDLSSFVISGAGFATQAATTNSCPQGLAIAPGEFCQIGVTLTPTHAGSYSGTLTFTSNSLKASGTTHTVALSGYSYGVYMVPSPATLDFGSQNTGTTSSAQTVTLTNNGYYYVGSVYSATVPDPAYSVTVPSACNSVAVGASCQLSVTFTPTAAQSYSGTVTLPVSSSGGGSVPSATFTVSGAGINPVPIASLSPALSFPSTNAGVTATALAATLFNTGTVSLTGITPTITGTNPGDFALSTGTSACGSTLAADSSCLIYVTFTPAGGAAYSATLSVADNAATSPQTVALTGTGVLNAQTISFTQPTSPQTYASGLTVPLVATGGASGNPVVFTVDAASTGTGAITGSTLTVTGVGSIVIDANQAGNTSYSAATQVQRTVQITQAAQTINFTQPTSPVTYASGLTVPLVATGGASGNPIVFSISDSSTGAGTISGSTLTVTGAGSIVIDASQAGNTNYAAATQAHRTIQVTQAAQAITFTQPTSPVIFSSGLAVSLVATGGASGNPVVFTIDASSTGTGSISGSTLTVTGAGSIVIDANQAGNTNYAAATQVQRTLVVNNLATQAITFAQPTSPETYSSGLTIPLSATGGASGNPVVFTIDASSTGTGTISGSTLTVAGAGIFVIDANQAGNASYSAAPQVQRTVQVTPAAQAISFTQPASPVTFSSGLTVSLAATGGASGNPIVFSLDESSTGTGAISGSTLTVTGAGNFVIDANQAGNTNYSAASQVQRTIVVQAAPPVPPDFSITPSPASQSVTVGGSAAFTISAASVTGNFTTPIQLSVSGLPAGATGTFSPASITPGGESSSSTLTVTTATQAASSKSSSGIWPIGGPALALLVLLPMRRWRKFWRGRLPMFLAAFLTLAASLSLTACGGGFAFPITSRSYTLTISGTGGTDTHTTTVQLTVQN